MAAIRILAVSFIGGRSLRNITHVWTAGGVISVEQALDEVWRRRSEFYVLTPGGQVAVQARPARGPSVMQRLLGASIEGTLESSAAGKGLDALLALPKLPSPNRGRRSEQHLHAEPRQTSAHPVA